MKKRRKIGGSQRSRLQQHKKVGKVLLPPMLHMMPGKLHFSSWVDERIPEYIWAALITAQMPRPYVMALFEELCSRVAVHCRLDDDHVSNEDAEVSFPQMTMTGIGELSLQARDEFFRTISTRPELGPVLRPLLLFDSFPLFERWKEIIGQESSAEDIQALAAAVLKVIDHQSQESTDIRWMAVVLPLFSDRLRGPAEMWESFQSYITLDPGDERMRSIRPSVRACEMSFRAPAGAGRGTSEWSRTFWSECMFKTDCVNLQVEEATDNGEDIEALIDSIDSTARQLFCHCLANRSPKAPDARVEAIYGFGFYGLTLLLETLGGRARFGVAGRLLLRALVESQITFAYLRSQRDDALWDKFRVFGVGQTKLAALKANEMDTVPAYLDARELELMVNEDKFEEFVPVELGHWCSIDLRKMAENAQVKDAYDMYYGWTSVFAHGTWAGMRITSLNICGNPLHRFHKIPSASPRPMASTVSDAVIVANRILEMVNEELPGFDARIELKKKGAEVIKPPHTRPADAPT